MVELDAWIEKVQRAEYLAEDELKALCEYVGFIIVHPYFSRSRSPGRSLLSLSLSTNYIHNHTSPLLSTPNTQQVKEILVEESNVQPVNSPVTVRSN